MAARSALISGASIAGPALAFWLAEAGWNVTVVERGGATQAAQLPDEIRLRLFVPDGYIPEL